MRKMFYRLTVFVLAGLFAFAPGLAWAQDNGDDSASNGAAGAGQSPEQGAEQGAKQAPEQASEGGQPLNEAELEQLVAPIALYPDSLLAQVLMASTYPLEVVSAARWQKNNLGVKGKALDEAMQKQPWDASVKSLTSFPQVLQMMNDKLDWTENLGNTFLAQQKETMAAVQRLRTKAKAHGSLASNAQQKVEVEPVTSGGASTQTIIIEPAQPSVVYVPTYNPTVVYGAWAYPAYPPYYWYPAGYVASNIVSFSAGLVIGSALWGGFDWGHGDVHVNVNNYNNYTHGHYHDNWNHDNNSWHHDSSHRGGVPYNNRAVANHYNKGNYSNRSAAQGQAREQLRGFTQGQGFSNHNFSGNHARGGAGSGGSAGGDHSFAKGQGQRLGGGGSGEQRHFNEAKGQHFGGGAGSGSGAGGGQKQFNRGAERNFSGASHGFQPGAFQGMNRGGGAGFDGARGASSRQFSGGRSSGGSRFGGGHSGGGRHMELGGGKFRR